MITRRQGLGLSIDRHITECVITKQWHEPIGTVMLHFNLDRKGFSDLGNAE